MPWITIICALITFFMQKSAGAKDASAAAWAAAAGLGAYYVFDPANPTNYLGTTYPSTTGSASSSVNPGTGLPPSQTSGSSVIGGATDVLKSWGPMGTAAVIGTTAAAADGFFSSKNLPWIVGGVALIALLK